MPETLYTFAHSSHGTARKLHIVTGPCEDSLCKILARFPHLLMEETGRDWVTGTSLLHEIETTDAAGDVCQGCTTRLEVLVG